MRARSVARPAVAGLLLLSLFFARAPLVGPRTFFLRDLHAQWFGQVASFREAIGQGAWPLWDPYPAFGQPMLANPNAQVLYPTTWLTLALPPWTFYALYFALHLLLAGLGVRRAAIALGASPVAAASAAVLWMGSGPLLSLGNLWNHLAGAAWLPWAIAAALTPGVGSVLGWGAAIGLMVLAGSPDMALMGGLVSGALALGAGRVSPRRALARAGGAAAFALALSAGQWWPALDWALEVGRLDLSRAARLYWSVPPAGLWQVLVPVPWQSLALLGSGASPFDGREPLLLSVYLGLPTLGLALLGIWRGPRRVAVLLTALAGAAVLVALGDRSPVHGWLSESWLLLRPMRFPAKALVPASGLVVLLAALGLDAWRSALAAGRRREALAPLLPLLALPVLARTPLAGDLARPALLAGLVLAAACWVRGNARRAVAAAAALVALALLDLAAAHDGLNPAAPRDLLAVEPAVAGEMKGRRNLVIDYGAHPGLARRWLGRDTPYPPDGPGLALRDYPVPPVSAAWRARGAWGRNLLGLQPREYDRLSGLTLLTEDAELRLRMLRLGAVERVVALHRQGFEALVERRQIRGSLRDAVRVFDVPAPIPRISAVGRAWPLPDEAAERRLVLGPFEPTREVLLAAPLSGQAQGAAFSRPARIRVDRERADQLRLEADLPAEGWLVVSDLWAPGWRGAVDGRPVAVERANLIFRALRVPVGRHAVCLDYRPRGLAAALGVSAAALALGLAFLARPRQPSPPGRHGT